MTGDPERITVRGGLALRAVERGEGPPILLIHGFTGSIDAWGDRILGGLAETHRVIAVDLPGHGRSDAPTEPAPYALGEVVAALAELLGEMGAPRAHWIGYSMGGRIALGAALLAPERVDRLVLEGASPGLEDEDERKARREQDEALAKRLEREGIAPFVDAWAELPLFETQRRLPEAVRAAQKERRLRNDPAALAACLRGLGTGVQPSFWDRLGDVRARTLLVTGEEDGKFTDVAEQMARRIPECRQVVVPGVGHAVHLEASGAWLEAVRGWVG